MTDGNRGAIHRVVVTVTDVSSGSDVASGSFVLLVRDKPRVGTVTGSGSATVGVPYLITVNTTDPGDDTVVSYVVNWGDGNSDGVFTHTYSAPGTFKVTVWSLDEEDIFRIGAHLVTVSP